jgi:hypothetical protein
VPPSFNPPLCASSNFPLLPEEQEESDNKEQSKPLETPWLPRHSHRGRSQQPDVHPHLPAPTLLLSSPATPSPKPGAELPHLAAGHQLPLLC